MSMARPLDDITVLDLTHALAGPFCSTMLADYGANVIKLEPPGGGDLARVWGAPVPGPDFSYFVTIHRNKRSIVVDLKKPEGKALFFKLVEKADVVIENFRVGGFARLGFEDAALEALRPDGWAGMHWSSAIAAEALATRRSAGLFDESSFAKIEIAGAGAPAFLDRLCANDVVRDVGAVVYTQLLNRRGGIEADLTVTRLAPDRFYLVTGTAFGTHDLAWIRRHAPEDGSVVVGKILDNAKFSFGFNAQSGEYGDLVSQGVIDPTKVVRTALQDAASVSGLLITTEAAISEKPDDKPAMPPMGGGMGGMGGMDF